MSLARDDDAAIFPDVDPSASEGCARDIVRRIEGQVLRNHSVGGWLLPGHAMYTAEQQDATWLWRELYWLSRFQDADRILFGLRTADDELVGICSWLTEDRGINGCKDEVTTMIELQATGRQANAGMNWIPPTLDRQAWVTLFHSYERERQQLLSTMWPRPISFITHIMVTPEHQRKGHGSRMLKVICAWLNVAQRSAYATVTAESVRLFSKFNFVIVSQATALGGIILTTMRRDPERPSFPVPPLQAQPVPLSTMDEWIAHSLRSRFPINASNTAQQAFRNAWFRAYGGPRTRVDERLASHGEAVTGRWRLCGGRFAGDDVECVVHPDGTDAIDAAHGMDNGAASVARNGVPAGGTKLKVPGV
ncbi:hypothetical protein RJ55_03581 [Drechmeria coniospora]|nr:hypothetical protein RJ55_03581 [Drechmeria coniospora]